MDNRLNQSLLRPDPTLNPRRLLKLRLVTLDQGPAFEGRVQSRLRRVRCRRTCGVLKSGPSITNQPHMNTMLETSLPGVFAVGDIRAGSVKRVASAVGEGSMAVQFVHRVLAE